MGFCSGLFLCSLPCSWEGEMRNFFGVRILGSFPPSFLWTYIQRAFLKGAEIMPSSNVSSAPRCFGAKCLPPPASAMSFIRQALPNSTVIVGQFRSTTWMVRGRERSFLLFLLCSVSSLEMCGIFIWSRWFFLLSEQLNPKFRFWTSLGHAVWEVQIWFYISLGCHLCKEREKGTQITNMTM